MSYIGQHLPPEVFGAFTVDTFTGDGSATTFTLSKEPASDSALIVVVDNVIQQPTTNFTVSGTTLTIVGTAILSGIKGYAIHTQGKIPSSEVALNTINANTISENTAGSGVTIDSLLIKDQKITNWVGAAAQVVGASITGAVSVTSTTYTDTGATVTITPQYATSKILVWARGCFTMGKGHDTTYAGIKLVRNIGGGSFSNLVTPMADTNGPYEIGREEAGTGENISVWANYYNYVFLDDPDTTSACIYKLQARPYDSSDSQYIAFGNTGGGGGGQSQQMVVMEILHGS